MNSSTKSTEKESTIRGIRFYRDWANRSFLPAIETAVKKGMITEAAYKRLIKHGEKYRFTYKEQT